MTTKKSAARNAKPRMNGLLDSGFIDKLFDDNRQEIQGQKS